MRAVSPLLLVVLIAAAIVMLLNARSAKEAFEGVQDVAVTLQERNVTGRQFDRDQAAHTIAALDQLLATPDLISVRADWLRTVADLAAAWARAAAVPSPELRVAVSVRGAADELRSYALRPSRYRILAARRLLAEARAVLAGEAVPYGPVEGLRDQIENLDRAHQEQHQRLDEELKR